MMAKSTPRKYLQEKMETGVFNDTTTKIEKKEEKQNLHVNDIVLLKDESSPRNEWPLGRVQEVEQSNDGLAPSVKLKTVY